MATQPTFEQRISELRNAAQMILAEVDRMQAAAERFAARSSQRKTASR